MKRWYPKREQYERDAKMIETWKGTASIKREKYSINRRRGIQKSNQIQELNKQLPKQTHYIDTQEIRQYWRDNELEDRMKETTIKIKRREIAKILRRHVGQNRKDQNTSIKVSRENEENCNDEKYGFIL